jgi:hypothetical protein
VCFIAGVKKLRQKDAYEVPREAVSVEEFWAQSVCLICCIIRS